MSEAKYGTVKTIMRQALWPEITNTHKKLKADVIYSPEYHPKPQK